MRDDLRDLLRGIPRAHVARRLHRPVVNLPISIHIQQNREDALGRDLNEHGLRLRTQHPLTPNQRIAIHLRAPGLPNEVVAQAIVRWARPDVVPEVYVAGLQFQHTTKSRLALRELLVMLAKRELPQIQRSGHTTRRRLNIPP